MPEIGADPASEVGAASMRRGAVCGFGWRPLKNEVDDFQPEIFLYETLQMYKKMGTS